MITGLLMVFAAGLFWAAVGVVFSGAARRGLSPVALSAVAAAANVAAAWLILPDYTALAQVRFIDVAPVAAVILTAGLFSASGMLLVQGAMRHGHHGAAWTIAQSSLVIPFLVGTLWLGEPLLLHRVLGVALVLTCLVMVGGRRSESQPRADASPRDEGRWTWFILAVLALLAIGVAQVLITLPSHWPRLRVHADLRVPMIMLGSGIGYWGAFGLRRRTRPLRPVLPWAMALAAVTLLGQVFFFPGLDRLERAQMVSVGFPLAMGTCIVVFALYSLLVARERAGPLTITGLCLGTAGVVLVAM